MTELITLLDSIASDIEFQGLIADGVDEQRIREKSDGYFHELKNIYARIDRHRYSDISKYIDSQLQDTVDSLKMGMNCIIKCAEANDYDKDGETSDNYKCYKKIVKLFDHIELEVARYSSIKKIELVADTYSKQEQEVQELLSKAEATVGEAHNQAKNLSQQLISILGIFAGLIVTFSFATTIVGETVANLAKSDVLYLVFVICVLGLVFINVIAFLLSFVTKLSGHKFSQTFPWFIYALGNIVILVLLICFYNQIKLL